MLQCFYLCRFSDHPTAFKHAFPPPLPEGGATISVCSSYLRDPDDGTLSPALVLELEGMLLEQVNMKQPPLLHCSCGPPTERHT